MTGRVVVGTDEGSGTSEEGVGTSGDDDGLGLSVLAGRSTGENKTVVRDDSENSQKQRELTRSTRHPPSYRRGETLR